MKMNVTFKEQNEVLKANFEEVTVLAPGDDPATLAKGREILANYGIILPDTSTIEDVIENIRKIPSTKYAYAYQFQRMTFPENTELVVYLPESNNLNAVFVNTRNVVKIKVIGNEKNNAVNFNSTFNGSAELEVIDFTEFTFRTTSIGSCFNSCKRLVSIFGVLNCASFSTAISTFNMCYALRDITLMENTLKCSTSFAHCSELTEASRQSIMGALMAVETQQTLTFNAKVFEALTDEEILEATNKNWVVQ